MNVVKDKELTLLKADEIASMIIKLIGEETKNFHPEDDPAEQIYLGCHVLGNLYAKILISLEGYGKIYGIANLSIKSIGEWVDQISKEYIANYAQK